jgi:hypothetical protein
VSSSSTIVGRLMRFGAGGGAMSDDAGRFATAVDGFGSVDAMVYSGMWWRWICGECSQARSASG